MRDITARARRRGRPAPERRPADVAALPAAGQRARHERRPRARSITSSSCRCGRGRSCTTSSPASASRGTRSTRRSTRPATPTAARRAGRAIGCSPTSSATERWFTGEHIFRWMWEDYGELRSHRAAAEILAEHEWPRLYDADAARAERGAGRGDDLRRRPVRRSGLRRGDRPPDPRPAAVDHERVPPQRPSRRRRARARPADRPRARPGLIGRRGPPAPRLAAAPSSPGPAPRGRPSGRRRSTRRSCRAAARRRRRRRPCRARG